MYALELFDDCISGKKGALVKKYRPGLREHFLNGSLFVRAARNYNANVTYFVRQIGTRQKYCFNRSHLPSEYLEIGILTLLYGPH